MACVGDWRSAQSLETSDLLMQLERCDETQLRAVSALLEAFDPDSIAG